MTFEKDKYFTLYANCIPVKGYKKAIIYDLEQKNYYIVPLSLIEVYEMCYNLNIDKLYTQYSEIDKKIIDKYIYFGIENNIGFFCSETDKENYIPLSLEFDTPYLITNSIIESDNYNQENIFKIVSELNSISIPYIQFFFKSVITINNIINILIHTKYSNFETIEFILPYSINFTEEEIMLLEEVNKRLFKIIFYKSYENSYKKINNTTIVHVMDDKNNIECGKIDPTYFLIHLPFFTESQQQNTCLNRKVCIDVDGNIKNCPTMDKSYGNIKNTTIKEAINKNGFKDLWYINKDNIDVCKDCEYRYMCSDCRAFLKDPDNIYSQPLKCTYNPYIGKWEGQKGYCKVEECGMYSKDKGFIPDKEKIDYLNKQI